MDDSTSERIFAFQTHMGVSWSQLAQEEIAAGKRWHLLQALAFIATGDLSLVEQVRLWLPHYNALPHPNAAQAASIHLSREVDKRRTEKARVLSLVDATRRLLAGINGGELTTYVDAKPTLLTGLGFREITYHGDDTGLAPPPAGDGRYWRSVYVNADDVRRVGERDSAVAVDQPPCVAPPSGAKRGPKPKWDWLNLMGELVRVADQDGLDSIGTQADVERWASNWLAEKAGLDAGPAESLVREHIAPVFDAVERHNQQKSRVRR